MSDLEGLEPALRAARSGDEWGISTLYQALAPRVLRFMRHKAPDAAEDLASETWLSVAQRIGEFDGDMDDFLAWLFTIARRRVADHYRGGPPPVPTVPDSLDAEAADISSEALSNVSAQEALETILDTLPPDQAEVVMLRILGDLSVEQVSRIMGRTTGSVRVLQHRAVKRLLKEWNARPPHDVTE